MAAERPNLVLEGATDVDSICQGIGRDLRSNGIEIPPDCRCSCLREEVRRALDVALVKSFASIVIENQLLLKFKHLTKFKSSPPQSYPQTTAS